MFRLRRSRLFLVAAALAVVTLYHLSRRLHWDGAGLEGLVRLRPDASKATTASLPDLPPFNPAPIHPASIPQHGGTHDAVTSASAVEPRPTPGLGVSSSTTAVPSRPTVTGEEFLSKNPSLEDIFEERGRGRYEVAPVAEGQPRAYWQAQREKFPVAPDDLLHLPSGSPKQLPPVQHKFGREASSKKADRLVKQTAVREAFKHAWTGYQTHALPHDELKPLSKGRADPFNGWGATLVDALDTLWIMGLRDEFDAAVKRVAQIDFKTSARKDIPLFETTIRYLGGLIAAYDLSGAKHTVLLDKAVELADVLMGAFDTPNRMPATYYNWAPSYASQPHRANAHTVLAELGSLSLEFTRLAQITQEARYYDVVARISDALELWQSKTTMPGLWPLKLDASGCRKPDLIRNVSPEQQPLSDPLDLDDEPVADDRRHDPDTSGPSAFRKRDEGPAGGAEKAPVENVPGDSSDNVLVSNAEWEDDYTSVNCESQGLSTEPHASTHTYGIGAMGDSTYEYLPKEYALLGGSKVQYQTMYMEAIRVVREKLLFRPMTPDNADILFVAKQSISPKATRRSKRQQTTYEATHLGCFAGGMFALGAKIFGLAADMDIARRLTDGCVWAYASTPVGIMPEDFELVPCGGGVRACPWNETTWHEALDPRREERFKAVEAYNTQQIRLQEMRSAAADEPMGVSEESRAITDPSMNKRDVAPTGDVEDPTKASRADGGNLAPAPAPAPAGLVPPPFVPRVPLSHEKYVAARIAEERLPPGYTKIHARDYRLRPEAIESVFIMFRLTGDEAWRDKGWAMFEAVDRATKTEVANAGIKDVTSQLLEQQDTMESFWLAETLKYYYLLFSEPDLISLDDYVLNTEAHPFKRPR